MKAIPGFSNYSITKNGCVWSKYRNGRWLRVSYDSDGYPQVILCTNKKRRNRKIHRLVLETYVGPCPNGMECRHLNGNPVDNRLENLCWGTKSENQMDSLKHGTAQGPHNKGEKNGQAKLTENQVRLIFNAYYDGVHTQQELADYFGVTQSLVSLITKKEKWGHVLTK